MAQLPSNLHQILITSDAFKPFNSRNFVFTKSNTKLFPSKSLPRQNLSVYKGRAISKNSQDVSMSMTNTDKTNIKVMKMGNFFF